MTEVARMLESQVIELILPVVVFALTLISGFVLRKFLFQRFLAWAKNTKTEIDDIIIRAVKGPFIIWCLMLGIYFGLRTSALPIDLVNFCGKILKVLGIVSVTLVLSNIAAKSIRTYSAKMAGTMAVTSLTQNIARIVIFGFGTIMVLHSVGISVAPILATLGVGGIAVALALQDTLSNLFAGFHIIVARQIKVGDYIKLESGEEGYVTDITWRTTKIRMLPNNVVLVPNDKLTKTIITNYYLPDKELAVVVNLGVHYKSDLSKVERVTTEVAREVQKNVPGAVPNFEPAVRYHTFGDFSINLSVSLRAREFVDQHVLKHEFIKRLHERYNKEGIVIPYPIQAVNHEQEKYISS